MNIIERNFYRLLRVGALHTEEQIEPLSAWKWNRLYQLAEMHDVAAIIYKGIEACRGQFFVQVPEKLLEQWAEAVPHDETSENDLITANRLTNPILNRQLQNILDAEGSNIETRTALLHLVGIARFIMNAGIPVKRLTELAAFLRQPTAGRIDFSLLESWIIRLKLGAMAQLTAAMLVRLMHFTPEELPFMQPTTEDRMDKQMHEILRQKNSHAEEWYFSQGKDIFIHTSNAAAMLWHVRRSAKYFSYYPTETVTNFFTTFAHSLSHIEE